MTTFVHKKLNGVTVQKFLHEIREEGMVTLNWKKGPFTNTTRFNAVNISHWPNKETLMFQRPNDATDELNERFSATASSDTNHEGNTNAHGQRSRGPTMITNSMIDDLSLHIRRWGNQQQCHESEFTYPRTQDTQLWLNLRQDDEKTQSLQEKMIFKTPSRPSSETSFNF